MDIGASGFCLFITHKTLCKVLYNHYLIVLLLTTLGIRTLISTSQMGKQKFREGKHLTFVQGLLTKETVFLIFLIDRKLSHS